MTDEKKQNKPMILFLFLVVTGVVLAPFFQKGIIQQFPVWALLLAVVALSFLLWLFVYSPLGKWLNSWLMKSYNDFAESVEKEKRSKK